MCLEVPSNEQNNKAIKMNNKLKAALVMLSLAGFTQAAQSAPTATPKVHISAGNASVSHQEAFCTALASLAEYTAQGRANGVSEKKAVSLAAGVAGANGIRGASLQVVTFVYASQLSVKDAKAVVYVNCLNRNFN
jgi:hypothetical protein